MTLLPRRVKEAPAEFETWPMLSSFQRDLNRMFEDFFPGIGVEPWTRLERKTATFMPKVDVVESPEEMTVTAELPGIDEKDIEITLTKDFLVIKGEKKQEQEKKEEKGRYYYERSYGAFERVVPLTAEVDEDKVDASFKKGVLTLKLPKTVEAKKNVKKISVRSA